MRSQVIDPGWAWTKKFNISAGQRVGNTVYLSGLVAFDSEGNLIGGDDVYRQTLQIFHNIEVALATQDAGLADLVRITTYLTDVSRYPEFSRARREIFPDGPPASTAIATPALVLPELLIEIEATAVIGAGGA
jgi:2-iminobutanoate/2-iminopropanoate deaminase